MSRLPTPLSNYVMIYIPSTVNVNTNANPLNILKAIKNVSAELANMFGGASASKLQGSWVSDTDGLVTEDITTVKAFTYPLTDDELDKVINICDTLKTEFSQEAISLEIDNRLYFI